MHDLLILTVNEMKPTMICKKRIIVDPQVKSGDYYPKYYHSIWPLINNIQGIIYKVYTDGKFGEFECCNDMFNIFYNFADDNTCIDIESVVPINHYDCVPMIIKEEYITEFKEILSTLLSSSPINMIAFLCSCQSDDKEVIQGTIDFDDFFDLMLSKKIRTNICYFISHVIPSHADT